MVFKKDEGGGDASALVAVDEGLGLSEVKSIGCGHIKEIAMTVEPCVLCRAERRLNETVVTNSGNGAEGMSSPLIRSTLPGPCHFFKSLPKTPLLSSASRLEAEGHEKNSRMMASSTSVLMGARMYHG